MLPERLAPTEAYEPRAITLIRIPLIAETIELRLRDACEPATEVFTVVERM